MSHEQSPEDQLNQAVAKSAAQKLCKDLAEDKGLSLADLMWELPREEIAMARTKVAGMSLDVDKIAKESSKETAELVMDFVFSEFLEKPLPRDILDVKPDESLDYREKIPVVPHRLEQLLEQDFINYQSISSDSSVFDIEL